MEDVICKAAQLITERGAGVALTGAGILVEVNIEENELSALAHVTLRGSSGEAFPGL
jgi:hypothetical protein